MGRRGLFPSNRPARDQTCPPPALPLHAMAAPAPVRGRTTPPPSQTSRRPPPLPHNPSFAPRSGSITRQFTPNSNDRQTEHELYSEDPGMTSLYLEVRVPSAPSRPPHSQICPSFPSANIEDQSGGMEADQPVLLRSDTSTTASRFPSLRSPTSPFVLFERQPAKTRRHDLTDCCSTDHRNCPNRQ